MKFNVLEKYRVSNNKKIKLYYILLEQRSTNCGLLPDVASDQKLWPALLSKKSTNVELASLFF